MTAGSRPPDGQRLDQWLCFSRLTKSRTLAQALIERGKVRVNREKANRASLLLKPGDVVTFSAGPRVRVFNVKGIGARRRPAAEAQALYEELTPATVRTKSSPADNPNSGSLQVAEFAAAVRPEGAGRPTKRERRDTDRFKDRFRES